MIPEDLLTNVLGALRWIHFLAGITWIGMLYFFNLVNVKVMKELDAATKGKVVPVLMPKALFWFRWGAVVTVATGLLMHMGTVSSEAKSLPSYFWLWIVVILVAFTIEALLIRTLKKNGYVVALTITVLLVLAGFATYRLHIGANPSWKVMSIAFGGGIGVIMFMNVWMIIWPLQKKIIAATKAQAEAGTAPPAEMPVWARRAFLASRTNAWLSIPMLFFMGAASHFPIGIGK